MSNYLLKLLMKKQKNESAKKLQTAQTAMREAALEQHQNANKYDFKRGDFKIHSEKLVLFSWNNRKREHLFS